MDDEKQTVDDRIHSIKLEHEKEVLMLKNEIEELEAENKLLKEQVIIWSNFNLIRQE